MLSTQENIEDARERRNLRLRGRKELFQCDNCQFESGSKTLLTKHVNTTHKDMIVDMQEMRKRFACDVCGFKTTSKTTLTMHTASNHKAIQKGSKRIKCSQCNKQFNKESTYKQHMNKQHKMETK